MKKSQVHTKAERRELKKRPRMVVQGASVKKIQRIIIRRAHKLKPPDIIV